MCQEHCAVLLYAVPWCAVLCFAVLFYAMFDQLQRLSSGCAQADSQASSLFTRVHAHRCRRDRLQALGGERRGGRGGGAEGQGHMLQGHQLQSWTQLHVQGLGISCKFGYV